ncbi:Uncharacterised protein [Halioglobus japonicus]|nr:Uncharacterised protein [Halioglobus japonicus]
MQPFFGDLHVHTRYSLDASTQGTRTTPEQAYRFAQGEALAIQPWVDDASERSIQLDRPLDFAMVADHAELFGEVHMCSTPGVEGHESWECLVYRHWPWGAYYLFNFMSSMQAAHLGLCGKNDAVCNRAAASPWQEMQQAAELHYDRSPDCVFTTFVGYEWTGTQPTSGGNLHRNVVFRNADVPQLPISFIDRSAAEELWRALDEQCSQRDGNCESLAIPHNSNISAGYMFDGLRDNGSAMTSEYARLRHRYEPLMEIMQKGGASECFFEPGVSRDELCDFERQPIDNLAGFNNPPGPDTGFARKALGDGMSLRRRLGVNPYQLGFVASTDTHLGAPGAVSETNYVGHGDADVSAREEIPPGLPDKIKNNPGGLAVLWAQENSRDALFEALQRREVYGTSGPRIVSRFFGGWNFSPTLCSDEDRIAQAYADGVAMGGQLVSASASKPTFLVVARQDSGTVARPGTALQRVQIVKGWLTPDGDYREHVFDVAGTADNGAAVDPQTCVTRGDSFRELCAVWADPDFQREAPAYYYSRVLENPSCRWSQRICLEKGVDCDRPETVGEGLQECCAPEHQSLIQERAWSSPIWYYPAKQ